ncbi:uncharacterized protein si:dkeyp-75h12.7 isoform X2 [Haplochromis burtoni]|uniref:uncharacterized protein si:dkeyp-75h12.7 isoform X2 n=1 Tax=Haplochromis burtoni TaxID=8153 RepID=UPI0003BC6A47|nr:uncharacterized protein si:dkeyp-75h12.7 isoform X2 [Haplochromis burtoni]
METQSITWLMVLLGLYILFITGSSELVCYTAVESLDLGCLLQWDCPHASPNTTYTVQTKTQGDPWQDVPWCIWISSRSCDISQVFSNFELYNMIRLGVHLSPSSTVWLKPRKFDYSDFNFSPPSVSVSLKDDQMVVQVHFPCAANRRCSLERCCPISKLIDPWTTVTVYTEPSGAEYQSRTVWTQEVVSYVEFSGLPLGQKYCAEANFSFPTFAMAASPKSAPQCVETVASSGLLPALCMGIGLTSLLLFPILIMYLRKSRQATPATENQPKAPSSAQEPIPLVPLSPGIVDPCEIHLEFIPDHVSTEPFSGIVSNQNLNHKQGSMHSSNRLNYDAKSDEVYWDSGGMELDRGLDSGISIPPVSRSSEETCEPHGD